MQNVNNRTGRRADPDYILSECQAIMAEVENYEAAYQRSDEKARRLNDAENLETATSAIMAEQATLTKEVKLIGQRMLRVKQHPDSAQARNQRQVSVTDRRVQKLLDAANISAKVLREERGKIVARDYRRVHPEATDSEVREASEDMQFSNVYSQAVSPDLLPGWAY